MNIILPYRHVPAKVGVLIYSPPPAGQGFHNWLFRAARALHSHWPASRIRSHLEAASAHCGRFVSSSEIEDAICNSRPDHRRPRGQNLKRLAKRPINRPIRQPDWPGRDETSIAKVLHQWDGYTLGDLWDESYIRLDSGAPDAEEIMDTLFPGNPLLCCGHSVKEFDTLPRDDWRGRLSSLQHLVPNPMLSRCGKTKEGKDSARCLNNTGPRRFLVVEFDQATIDEQACFLRHLAVFAPLALVVHSGGKSLHGWFYCHGTPEKLVRNLFSYAVVLGADRATWTPCQFVRLPEGNRTHKRKQSAYYFNPKVIR